MNGKSGGGGSQYRTSTWYLFCFMFRNIKILKKSHFKHDYSGLSLKNFVYNFVNIVNLISILLRH